MSKQTAYDRETAISIGQAIATTASTAGNYEIDLGSANFGEGEPIKLVINATVVGSSNVVTVKACSKTSASVEVTDNPITLGTISAVGQYHYTLPQNINRYFNLFYSESGGTAGYTVSAWLTATVN